jgi:hypothetical protein
MTSDKDECWWIAATATSRSPIVVVERAKSKVQRRDAEQ